MVITSLAPICALLVDDFTLQCTVPWAPPDMNKSTTFCVVPPSQLILVRFYIFHFWVTMVIFLNITFGAIFSFKLSQFNKSSDRSDNFQFEALIVKNNILTVVGCISTTLFYVLWFTMDPILFLFVDVMINCLVIGLMQKSNETLYKRLCGPCIMLCMIRSFKRQRSSTEMAEIKTKRQRTLDYINEREQKTMQHLSDAPLEIVPVPSNSDAAATPTSSPSPGSEKSECEFNV